METIKKALAFRIWPTTICVAIVYAAVIVSVLVTDELPEVPSHSRQQGLNLTKAYADLHQIAARPHPYNSHANDLVNTFLFDRVSNIGKQYDFITVQNDFTSNVSFAASGYGSYFEGTNVLVKVEGQNPELDAVLFSAHYDSVSTASGATDDGMGVATLLQLVDYLALNRPKRTAIFNINNGEEDWLYGAHAFLEHPWSNLTTSFLNLEGASSGGRPVLFRATSLAPVFSFTRSRVPHPHANVLSADAFARGVIRSGTDYEVYAHGGSHQMEGLDLAFYKGRSKYHTKYDSIPYTEGEQKSLYAMMEAAQGSALALLNLDAPHRRTDHAVYFDLFATVLVAFPLHSLVVFNIVFLSVGPIILLLLEFTEAAILHDDFRATFVHWFKEWTWLKDISSWLKFWVSLAATIGLQVLLDFGFSKLNPFAIYSSPYVVVLSSLCLAYLSLVGVLSLPKPIARPQTILVQTYILTWVLLFASTIIIGKTGVGGVYFLSAWNAVVFVGCVIGNIQGMFAARAIKSELVVATLAGDLDASETTPLLDSRQQAGKPVGTQHGEMLWWLVELLVVVPVPLILMAHIGVLMVTAMNQTITDGGSPSNVYAMVSLLTVLLILPIAPFSARMSKGFTVFIAIVFAATTAYSWLAFPFSADAPLKVYFQQQISVSDNTTITSLVGVGRYLQHDVVSKLPSAQHPHANVTCGLPADGRRQGLTTCTWNSGEALVPSSGGQGKGDWLDFKAIRLESDVGLNRAQITLSGKNTRGCKVYFDNVNITGFSVHGGSGAMQTGYEMPEDGVKEIRLWSRKWGNKFKLDVEWENPSPETKVTGRVGCDWAEYESGSIGLDLPTAKIPALEEALTFLPKWAVVTKLASGLVEVTSKFEI